MGNLKYGKWKYVFNQLAESWFIFFSILTDRCKREASEVIKLSLLNSGSGGYISLYFVFQFQMIVYSA